MKSYKIMPFLLELFTREEDIFSNTLPLFLAKDVTENRDYFLGKLNLIFEPILFHSDIVII